jgi:hypothetical protein
LRLFIVEDEKEICDTVAKSLYDSFKQDSMKKINLCIYMIFVIIGYMKYKL